MPSVMLWCSLWTSEPAPSLDLSSTSTTSTHLVLCIRLIAPSLHVAITPMYQPSLPASLLHLSPQQGPQCWHCIPAPDRKPHTALILLTPSFCTASSCSLSSPCTSGTFSPKSDGHDLMSPPAWTHSLHLLTLPSL